MADRHRRINSLQEWHEFFAIRPVRLDANTVSCFGWVQRRINPERFTDMYHGRIKPIRRHFEYRTYIKALTS